MRQKYALNKRTRKIFRKRTKQNRVSNLPDNEFKVMVMKMTRMDELSENINKEIKKKN